MDTQSLSTLQRALHVSIPACGAVSTAPAQKWDFGTVVGNGIQGALAFGRTSAEEIVLSHEELFLPLFPDYGYLPVKQHFDTIRELVLVGTAEAAQDLLRTLKKQGEFPGYNTTDPFVGAASLDLLMQDRSECRNYLRTIDFESGEALTAWEDEAGIFHRQFFVSRADNVLALRLSSPTSSPLKLLLGLREITYVPPSDPREQDIYAKTIDHCEDIVSLTQLIHRTAFKQRWDTQPVKGSLTIADIRVRGGTPALTGKQLRIVGADELLLLVRTVPDRHGTLLNEAEEREKLAGIEPDYDALLAAHKAIHSEIFNRCRLQLSKPVEQQRLTEDLQAESSVGNTSPALVEKAFAAGRYGIISSTGSLPPALQGVWTGTWKPRWSGDYTLNGNVQSMVAASLCGNHFECQESLMDYLDSLMDDFRSNARELLGFRGPLIPWRASTHGRTHYLAYRKYHHDFPGIYWFAGAAWFVQLYYDYYLYTGDEAFFEYRLKPFLLDALAFYEDYLTLEQHGKYVLSPSSSPENVTGENVWMAPNATMTIAAIKQILRTALRLQEKIDPELQQVDKWRQMLQRMPDYAIGANGALKEWTWPGIENNEAHRHASHLYPLFYGQDPEIAAGEQLREACRVAIDRRMAFRRPENGGAMAFGFVQLGLAAAHLGDLPLAYESLEYLVNQYWSPIMVSQHDHHESPDILNLDISGGLPALIITMLVQSMPPKENGQPWRIVLLPCLPDAWPQGHLSGVRCRGGFEIDLKWRQRTLERTVITGKRAGECLIEYRGNRRLLRLNENQRCVLAANLQNE